MWYRWQLGNHNNLNKSFLFCFSTAGERYIARIIWEEHFNIDIRSACELYGNGDEGGILLFEAPCRAKLRPYSLLCCVCIGFKLMTCLSMYLKRLTNLWKGLKKPQSTVWDHFIFFVIDVFQRLYAQLSKYLECTFKQKYFMDRVICLFDVRQNHTQSSFERWGWKTIFFRNVLVHLILLPVRKIALTTTTNRSRFTKHSAWQRT